MYRRRLKFKKKMATMRAAKERKRLDGPVPEYPVVLPDLRRRITIEDFDFGHVTHVIELHKTNRIDCYRAVADGRTWKDRIGWAKVLEGLRKSLPRVMAP